MSRMLAFFDSQCLIVSGHIIVILGKLRLGLGQGKLGPLQVDTCNPHFHDTFKKLFFSRMLAFCFLYLPVQKHTIVILGKIRLGLGQVNTLLIDTGCSHLNDTFKQLFLSKVQTSSFHCLDMFFTHHVDTWQAQVDFLGQDTF